MLILEQRTGCAYIGIEIDSACVNWNRDLQGVPMLGQRLTACAYAGTEKKRVRISQQSVK